MSLIELDNNVRAIIANNAFASILVTGTEKVRCGYGNGDSILVDIQNKLFAVADATERFPQASRLLLTNIAQGLNRIPTNRDEWLRYCNTAYKKQEYHLKTTMSMIALSGTGRIKKAFIAQGGDSTIRIMNKKTKKIVFKTNSNMNFAGRSQCLDIVHEVMLPQQVRVFIYSDGFNDVSKHGAIEFEKLLSLSLADCIDLVLSIINKGNGRIEYDDISLLVFDIPQIYKVNTNGYIMGGTTRLQEYTVDVEFFKIYDYDSLIK